MGNSSGTYVDPVHPMDVLLDLNPVNKQVKVMSGCCGANTPD